MVWRDEMVSTRTNREIDYAYYRELVYKYKDRTITDNERFDLELALVKFETNSYYR